MMHVNALLDHGPPQPNYRLRFLYFCEAKRRIEYVEGVSNKVYKDHPLSAQAAKLNPKIGKEFKVSRKDIVPLFQPPIPQYHAGNYVSEHHDDWKSAVTKALDNSSRSGMTARLVQKILEKLEKQGATTSDLPYHPYDRDTAVFENEPEAALVVSNCKRSLVILFLEVLANGVGWNRTYNLGKST